MMTPKRSYTRLSQSPSPTLSCRGLYRNKEAASIAILPPPPPLEGMLVQRRIPGCIGGNAMKQFFFVSGNYAMPEMRELEARI